MLSKEVIHKDVGKIEYEKFAIVLLNMGGPQNLGEVKPFLTKLFSDKDLIQLPIFLRPFQFIIALIIARSRIKVTQNMYSQIGGGSPIVDITNTFAKNIADIFDNEVLVKPVMRYCQPRAKQVIDQLEKLEIEKIILFSQYPYNSLATTGSSLKDFMRSFTKSRLNKSCKIIIIDDWGLEQAYLDWWSLEITKEIDKLKALGINNNIHVIFTVHGLPVSYIERGDKYKDQVEKSKAVIVDKVNKRGYNPIFHLSYQSKVGPVEWIKPYTTDIIREIADPTGTIVMVPLGFVTDHVETLYEIDILYSNLANELGVNYFSRVRVPGSDKQYCSGIVKMIKKSMDGEYYA